MNRLLYFLDRSRIRWTSRIISVALFGYAWYSLLTGYDLNQLDDTPGFRYGVVFACTTLWLLALLCTLRDSRAPKRSLPVDPHFPPTRMIYIQGKEEPERCDCHGRVIEDGAEIWHWPQPAKLLCVQEDRTK